MNRPRFEFKIDVNDLISKLLFVALTATFGFAAKQVSDIKTDIRSLTESVITLNIQMKNVLDGMEKSSKITDELEKRLRKLEIGKEKKNASYDHLSSLLNTSYGESLCLFELHEWWRRCIETENDSSDYYSSNTWSISYKKVGI